MFLTLYQPDITQNAGALIRLGACLDVTVEIIEPCGFLFSEAGFRRAGMDYAETAEIMRHASWYAFIASRKGRIVLLTTRADESYIDFMFAPDDTLLLGRETAGVPDHVHRAADARLRIPMRTGLRSLNVAQAGAMALAEALRQTNSFPK